MLFALGLLIGGLFLPYLFLFVGVAIALRGHFPNLFAKHLEAQIIAGIPYRRSESIKTWTALLVICPLLALLCSWMHRRVAPASPDLARSITESVRKIIQEQQSGLAQLKQHATGTPARLKPPPTRDIPLQKVAEPKEEEVQLIFKNATFFTEERKKVIGKDLRRFRAYLLDLRLPAPIDVPPLGVASQKYDASSGKLLYPARYQDLRIGQGAIDSGDWEYWILELYCEYSLRQIFKTSDPPADWMTRQEQFPGMLFGEYFCWYLTGSFLGKLPKEMTNPNFDALWQIRNRLGKSTADNIIAYGALAFNDSPDRGSFPRGEAYMYNRLLDGNSVIDNDGSNIPVLKKAWDERANRYNQRELLNGPRK